MRYRIHWFEEQGGAIYFDAESEEHAQELFEQLEQGAIDEDDLPNMVKKTRNGQYEYQDMENVDDQLPA